MLKEGNKNVNYKLKFCFNYSGQQKIKCWFSVEQLDGLNRSGIPKSKYGS